MNYLKVILILILTCSFTALSAQKVIAPSDSVSRKTTAVSGNEQSRVQEKDQARMGQGSHDQGASGQAGEVKQIRSAKPDFTKARGARPPSVERPSGNAIPRGAGRPGGAKGPGKR